MYSWCSICNKKVEGLVSRRLRRKLHGSRDFYCFHLLAWLGVIVGIESACMIDRFRIEITVFKYAQ